MGGKMHQRFLVFIWICIGSIFFSAVESVDQIPYWARETNLKNDLLSGNEVNFGIEYDTGVPPKTDDGDNQLVKVGISVFKVKEINVATSLMSLNIWMRLAWKDARLAWNASDPKYLNITQTTYKASTDPEITQIWVPDLELYNQAESLSHFSDKDVIVSPDGSVFWSRVGNLEVLCAFSGLKRHPFDNTECSIDLGGWTRSGFLANYTFMDPPVTYNTEPTSRSTYQEFRVVVGGDRTSRREFFYDCCPSEPWPILTFTFVFERLTTSYYLRSLVAMTVLFTFLAGFTCKLDIRCGERLGFGITILLAMVATEIIAAEMLPTCPEFLWIEVVTFGSTIFAVACLFESCVVTHIYYKQRKEDVSEFVQDMKDPELGDDNDLELQQFKDTISSPDEIKKEVVLQMMENKTNFDGIIAEVPQNTEETHQNNEKRNGLRNRFVNSSRGLMRFSSKKKKMSLQEKWSAERGLSMKSFELVQKIDHTFFLVFMVTYPSFLIIMYSSINLFNDNYAVNL